MCAFTRIHPLTDAALLEFAPEAERVDVSENTHMYGALVEQLWHDAETTLIVEHDVQLSLGAFRQALYCKCEWSTSRYTGHDGVLYSGVLGCTRFRSSLMQSEPDAVTRALEDRSFGADSRDWHMFDSRLYAVLRDRGHLPHVHRTVLHHHVYQGLCSCGELGEHG